MMREGEAKDEITLLTLDEILAELNRMVYQEIEFRHLSVRAGDVDYVPRKELCQIHISVPWSTQERAFSLAKYRTEILHPIAVEFGVKLARPFDLETFPLELPQSCSATAGACYRGLFMRGVADYSIATDEFLVRYDILVRWIEKE
jgi:hypothetical protein